MTSRLDETAARDVYLNLVRVHEKLSAEFAELFREHGLTQPQFNVLRILVDGPAEGLPCSGIGEQLLNRLPDTSRLIDRVEAAGLVKRVRSDEDRRVVLVRITPKGRKLCESLYAPVTALHLSQVEHLPEKTVATLNRGLERLLGT